ncbi:ferrous iron transport protein A [Streptomyces ferrugineus]|uniref:Ferrous iron transport protein A n=1 Tax=Streptomyces ferrugineus TaxID=1413221 RepID=A0A7M2SDD2_9ACTN|nr:FeoA family protein [Streptomyces ferrugineus]QOV33498.1 ferrous iron transport protein A [Streptomyces ferrugineus]
MSELDRECERAGDRAVAVIRGERCALADLAPGARATVAAVVADGSPSVARRLNDLGFTVGAVVEVVRRAPLRDPVVYRVKDYEVCLRRAQAAYVQVVEAER